MEKQLKCVLLLSLKEMALRRVAVLLWNGTDILSSIFRFKWFSKEWREAVEGRIRDKVLQLELPQSLAKEMIVRIRPMSLEVEAWIRNHYSFLRNLNNEISLPYSVKLCWTTAGTINYKRTVEELFRYKELDVEDCYELACSYCLEDYISLYWEELPEEKKLMYSGGRVMLTVLPYCWPHILKGEHSKLDNLARRSNSNLTSFNQLAFEHSAKSHRKTAAEYFFQKLTHEEREASLKRAVLLVIESSGYSPCEKRSDVLCYMLSVMTPEQQVETIKAHPVGVFLCFLHWPLQDLIFDNAGILWTFLPPNGYTVLLKKIILQYVLNLVCFPTVFEEFFFGSPPDLIKCFVEEEDDDGDTPAHDFLSAFFGYEDSKSIEVMFRNLDAADRVKLVFHRSVLTLFELFMLRDKWHLVEVCLRQAALTKEEKGRLADTFKGNLEREGVRVNRKFKRFFKFLDDTDASSDKQKKGQNRKLGNCSQGQRTLSRAEICKKTRI